MTSVLVSSAKASAFSVTDASPSFFAARSKAALLYQPGVPPFVSVPAFSNETPIVSAPYSNAATMRLASPYPVEQPSTSTVFGPAPPSFAPLMPRFSFCVLIYAISFSVSFAQPTGCALIQILLRTIGLIIITTSHKNFCRKYQLPKKFLAVRESAHVL